MNSDSLGTRISDAVLHAVVTVQVSLNDRRERGATAVEYALLLGLLTIAIMAGVSVFRSRVTTMFNIYSNTMPG